MSTSEAEIPRIELLEETPIPGLLPMANGRFLSRTLVKAVSNLFDSPVILTSDLHKDTAHVANWLCDQINPAEWEFISCGDMAGTDRVGEDASPLPAFRGVLERFHRFHFVLGNHDSDHEDLHELKNFDGTPCLVDRAPREVGGREVAGVSGIVGNPRKPGRRSIEEFQRAVEETGLVKRTSRVLLTHETPRVEGFRRCIGREDLTLWVQSLAPIAHVFGHCHLNPISITKDRTLYINVDARIVLLEPQKG